LAYCVIFVCCDWSVGIFDSVFIKFFIYSYQEQGQVTPGEQVTLEKAQRTKKMLKITRPAKAKVKSIQKSHHASYRVEFPAKATRITFKVAAFQYL